MSAGYLLLYAALAVVAVWLLAELLFQHRAPLHWRGLALAGFLAVVAGMALSSVPVIGLGAAAFATGQVFVTLAVKQGRPVGWSLRRPDGSLPGPLAKVPLLSAATGGAAVAAATAPEPVGEVGPVEESAAPEPVAGYEELAAMEPVEPVESVYAAPAEYYQQVPEQMYYQPDYGQQQYQPQPQQEWQPQPVAYEQAAYGYGYEQPAQQYQPQYQDPYAQQYQPQPQQVGWEYQQQPYQ
ncbi:hypothetical protein [Kitasatospora sp. MMS16-BH015]|uniref:hypothetical protein n=1 Tax=Kitasatospora sp. MMS16-BH015 TaxID=2018025 RepID=UPI000CF1E265|nr:hypothetical protein [Kitasatospora sp. MMS16-BH015]